ncbi:MAG: metallophosphoesterase [Propionibacteriaceae bacterium]|jgi:predicted MPP superfamily phosphohydrolase|nr:metallophosphoesterase [Propionibacteriaceae bacterium]
MRHQTAWIAGTLGALGGGLFAYGALIERNAFRLRHVRVPVLPAGHEPIRVLHLSDFHLTAAQSRKVAWIRALSELQPDFIVNTGDNLSSAEALATLARALRPLAGPPGVFVLGSNDFHGPRPINPLGYFTPRQHTVPKTTLPTAAIVLVLEGLGWTNIEQERRVFELRGSRVEVRGCGDAHIDLDDYAAVAGPVQSDVDLLIGVAHAPYRRILDAMTTDGAGLILAGHTHGGQVCLPGGRALTTNCDIPLRQAKGLSQHRTGPLTTFVHVSAGLGTSPYAPYRFACPPEATLLTLVARPEG